MESINDRIKLLIRKTSNNPSDFAKKLGKDRSDVIRNIINDKHDPSLQLLELIITKTLVNANWLITGKGEMFNENLDKPMEKTQDTIELLNQLLESKNDVIASKDAVIAEKEATIRMLKNRGEIEALEAVIKTKDELLECYSSGTGKSPITTLKSKH